MLFHFFPLCEYTYELYENVSFLLYVHKTGFSLAALSILTLTGRQNIVGAPSGNSVAIRLCSDIGDLYHHRTSDGFIVWAVGQWGIFATESLCQLEFPLASPLSFCILPPHWSNVKKSALQVCFRAEDRGKTEEVKQMKLVSAHQYKIPGDPSQLHVSSCP